MPVGRAPDVARGPSALKDGIPACTLPLALCLGHNLPVHPVLPNRRSREAETGGRGGELFLTLQRPNDCAIPSAPDTLYDLRDLYDGHCV